MKAHFLIICLSLLASEFCSFAEQDTASLKHKNLLPEFSYVQPVNEKNAEIQSINTDQIDPLASQPGENVVVKVQSQENNVPLSHKIQNLESFQEETEQRIAALETEHESVEAIHQKKMEALLTAEAEAQASDQANIDRLNRENQIIIDGLHEEQKTAEKKFKSQQAKINALGKQNRELMNQLGSFFESETVRNNANNSKNNQESVLTSVLQLKSTGGVSYIRWGRTVCDSMDATVLYEGFGGTSFNTDAGGGSDILCLHSQPRLDTSIASIVASQRATISGIEYGFVNTPFSYENNCGQTFVGSDMPCAVCHIQTRTQQIMIPARDTCPTGWTLEYWGFLVSSYSTQSTVAYTCLDHAPESLEGSFADAKSRYLYPIEAICGASLPCPPYVAGFGVPCVVCSS